jgi:hypothetical protein
MTADRQGGRPEKDRMMRKPHMNNAGYVTEREEQRALRERIAQLEAAARPFADLLKTSGKGRIPTERLSFAHWHAIAKCFKSEPVECGCGKPDCYWCQR